LDPQPNSESGKLEDFRADILYFLIKVAKDGNTGNIDYPGALPRLTDFAFMVTYQIPIGYRSAIDWGVTYTISHLITSFSLFQQNKIKYLGKNASDLHNSLITVGASAMQTAVFNVMIGTLGVAQGVAEYIRSKPKKKSEATSKL
jgi:SNF family Na+-dependent transporter